MTNNDKYFDHCINLISSDDPMKFEEGYHLLLPRVNEYGDKIAELIVAEKSSDILSKLVELLGECNEPRYIPIFKDLLTNEIHDVVSLSLTALENLPSKDGEEIANQFRSKNPKWLE